MVVGSAMTVSSVSFLVQRPFFFLLGLLKIFSSFSRSLGLITLSVYLTNGIPVNNLSGDAVYLAALFLRFIHMFDHTLCRKTCNRIGVNRNRGERRTAQLCIDGIIKTGHGNILRHADSTLF